MCQKVADRACKNRNKLRFLLKGVRKPMAIDIASSDAVVERLAADAWRFLHECLCALQP
jgi:hypothetical protein